jgi:hypothetical protein
MTMHRHPRGPENLRDPEDDDAFWTVVERGTNVWESLQYITKAVEGFDIDFPPVDADHPPQTNQTGSGDWVTREWEPGFYVQMNTWIKQGQDRTKSNTVDHEVEVDGDTFGYGARNVVFQCGFGRDNLDNFIYRPDASAMRNYVGVHTPGGQVNRGDRAKMAHVWVQDSAERYGQYHGWETAGQKDPKRILKLKAKYITAAYGYPPTYFDIEISPERTGGGIAAEEPYSYMEHFHVGDYITAEVKEGELHANLDGRVVRVTLEQQTAKKGVKTTVECVPRILSNLDEITESQE